MIAVILMVLSSISNTVGLWVTVEVDVVIVVGGVVDVVLVVALVVVLVVVEDDVVVGVVVRVVDFGVVLGPMTFNAGSKYVETSRARPLKSEF